MSQVEHYIQRRVQQYSELLCNTACQLATKSRQEGNVDSVELQLQVTTRFMHTHVHHNNYSQPGLALELPDLASSNAAGMHAGV